jgi:hypothetical protein
MQALLITCGAVALLLAGCGDDDGMISPDGGPSDAQTDAGPSCTEQIWDPAGGTLDRWPEPAFLVDDPATRTGKRLRFDPEVYSGIAMMSAGFLPVFTEDLADLDGFGVNAEVFLRFNRAFDEATVPSGEATSSPGAGLGMIVLDPAPRIEPVLVRFTDRGATLMLGSMHPFPAKSRAAVFVTRALTAAAGGCLEPNAAAAAELASPGADVSDAITAMRDLGIIADTSELIAVTVFPTQSTVDDSVLVAGDIAARDFTTDGPATCTTSADFVKCDGTFTAGDYRDADGVLRIDPDAVAPVTTYRVPFTVWLPPAGTGTAPHPALLFGHGLGSGREQGEELARIAAPSGIATVAIPALQHGEHPTNTEPGSGTLPTVLRFFAIGDLETRAFNGLLHRDYWRQSTYDKLQLTRILEAGMDVDGDGTTDLDPTKLAYLGASLGGIMGSELAALTDAYGAVILAVPGGRVSSMISDSETFGGIVVALRPRGVTEGDVARFFPILQTVLDRGDSASYGPHILRDRLVGDGTAPPPSVVLGVALDDDTVPNVANYVLARSIDVPIVPEVLRPVPGLGEAPSAPVTGNAGGGAATAGLLQFDVIEEGGTVRDATHSNTPGSPVAARAWLEFLMSHFDSGLAVIVDPYALEGLAHEPDP